LNARGGIVAKLIFTDEDERLIESFVLEFEPTTHPVAATMSDFMPSETWQRMAASLRAWIRNRVGMVLHVRAFAEAVRDHGLADEEGLDDFFRNTGIGQDNFGRAPEIPDDLWDSVQSDLPDNGNEGSPIAVYIFQVGDEIDRRLLSDVDPRYFASI
jgi:hypothetical protein